MEPNLNSKKNPKNINNAYAKSQQLNLVSFCFLLVDYKLISHKSQNSPYSQIRSNDPKPPLSLENMNR